MRPDQLPRALNAPAATELLLHGAFRDAAASVAILDLNGYFLEVNPAFCALSGYSEEELRRMTLADMTHPDDRSQNAELIQELCAGGRASFVDEKRYVSRSGATLWLHVSASLLRGDGDARARMIAVLEDVTQRYALEQTRKELLTEREALLNSAAEGIYGVDLEGRCTFVNRAAAKMFGYAPSEMLGENMHDLVHYKYPDGRPFPKEECIISASFHQEQGKHKSLRNVQTVLWREDGTGVAVELSSEAVVIDGVTRGTVVTLRDLTESNASIEERASFLRREQAALEDKEKLYEALRSSDTALRELVRQETQLLEALPQLVWAKDPSGGYEYCNQRWHQFTGLAAEQNPNEAWIALVHPEDRDLTLSAWARAMEAGETYQIEHRVRRSDGEYRWLISEGRPLLDASGKIVRWFGTSTDVHERKMAEAALRRSEKLAAAGRLAATVAHEINNPLEAVTNLIFLGAHAKGLPEEAGGYLEQASEELRRVAHIVSQTLGFYRDSSTPRLTDISVLMRDVLYLYNRKLENRGIRLCRSVDEGVYAMVIAGEIRQVVANLVANAIDAMPSGGVLGAEVHAHPESVEIAISDTGHGIPPAELESIFEAFYTTKKDTGTGLGLWVSKGIAEKHHGTLTVKSSQRMEDHGTVFTMVLPRMSSDTGEPIKRQS